MKKIIKPSAIALMVTLGIVITSSNGSELKAKSSDWDFCAPVSSFVCVLDGVPWHDKALRTYEEGDD